ncbi:hypothetical protein [Vibrio harveyi]|uniref:hypothetical protein n=1 Tax=Vibrio harveyi TaxID=669 RepID=UPI00165DBCAB|nr:hypothetical protein [Vibrio harveyi]
MKYQTDLDAVPQCPPQGCSPKSLTAYRFVFEKMDHGSFLPVGKMSPSRVDKARNNRVKCSMLALSMFDTEENALAKFEELQESNQHIAKSIGSFLAEGSIDVNDGLASKPNSRGHFDVFEFKDVDLLPKFRKLRAL